MKRKVRNSPPPNIRKIVHKKHLGKGSGKYYPAFIGVAAFVSSSFLAPFEYKRGIFETGYRLDLEVIYQEHQPENLFDYRHPKETFSEFASGSQLPIRDRNVSSDPMSYSGENCVIEVYDFNGKKVYDSDSTFVSAEQIPSKI